MRTWPDGEGRWYSLSCRSLSVFFGESGSNKCTMVLEVREEWNCRQKTCPTVYRGTDYVHVLTTCTDLGPGDTSYIPSLVTMHRSLGDFYCNSEFCCATRRTNLPTDHRHVFRPKATTPRLRDSLALYGDSPRRRVATSTYEVESKLGSNFPQNSPNYTRHVLFIHLSCYSIPHERMDG